MGAKDSKWIIGLLTQREDGHYYIEDNTYSIQVSFAQLEYVEPDAYFTENCIILAEALYGDGHIVYLKRVMHPPLHANKKFKFKINEMDYFGSYIKMTEEMNIKKGMQQIYIENPEHDLEQCVIVVSQLQIDQAKQLGGMKGLLDGLNQMRPEVIVLMGDYMSQESTSSQLPFDQMKLYFDQLGNIIRDQNLECLRDLTQWIIMPSVADIGVVKVMPTFKISEYMIQGFKGNGPGRIKNILLATNPMRMSFRGK